MKKETEQELISDVKLIKNIVAEIKEVFWKDHDTITKLSTVKEDFNKKFDYHIVTERWVFGLVFFIMCGILIKAVWP